MSALQLLYIVFVLWVLLNIKKRRPDGKLVQSTHPYRKVVFSINRNKSESQVQFEYTVDAQPILEYIQKSRSKHHLTLNHCIIAAVNYALAENPTLDRFVMGGRLYQRNERSISFTVKKIKLSKKAALGTVKLLMRDGESFDSLCQRISKAIERERQPKPTSVDNEMSLLSIIPAPILKLIINIGYWLNEHHLLPNSILKPDVMHTSIFVANLGSLQMKSAYHHLYEWGTCPIFITVGNIEETPWAEEGNIVMRKTLTAKFSFDERITDGLTAWEAIKSGLDTIESPERYFGSHSKDANVKPL